MKKSVEELIKHICKYCLAAEKHNGGSEMKIKVLRYSDNGHTTLGLLYVDGKFQCFTLEDEHRDVKVPGETRIPEGIYGVYFRTVGSHHKKYGDRFPAIHKGMLQIMDVPGFTNILIHIGNYEGDTSGCLLVGNTVLSNACGIGMIQESKNAYVTLYEKVANAIPNEGVLIEFVDIEKEIKDE